LAVAGPSTGSGTKAVVRLVAGSGDILVQLLNMQALKHIHLEAYSKSGKVTIFLPRNFRGPLQLKTRKGTFVFLPALTETMRILNAEDHEALVLVGDQSAPDMPGSPVMGDYCQLGTKSGKITVGLSGEDAVVPEVGFWKRMVSSFLTTPDLQQRRLSTLKEQVTGQATALAGQVVGLREQMAGQVVGHVAGLNRQVTDLKVLGGGGSSSQMTHYKS